MATGAQIQLTQARSLRMTVQLRQAIGLLQFTNLELARHLAAEARGNPYLELRPLPQPPEAGGGAPRAEPGAGRGGQGGATPAGGPGGGGEERLAAAPEGLIGHVRREIGLAFREPRARAIAERFAEALEPSGWLGRPVAEIAAEACCDAAEAEAVLARLQQIEPAGLFARSLAECLRLQAAERGVLDAGLGCVLDNLPLVGAGALDRLAALCGCDEAAVRRHVATIRSLDPKPGARFGSAPAPVMPPDVIVTRAGTGWEVDLNRATLPAVQLREGAVSDEADRALREAARWLRRAVESRNLMTLRVAAEVVRRQEGFLREGPAGLAPLRQKEVAAALGVHPSTVGRVAAGLLVQTPRGTLPLRALFGAALPGPGEGGRGAVAAAAVRNEIGRLIAAEDRARPMSDSALAAALSARGITVARRTVAKYREAQGLPGAAARRRRARLDAAPGAGAGRR